ncbi:MAG: DNA topoisomerase (ATP-hydrolyzing) subunit A [Candidatus Bruticola sp.]
MENRIAVAPAPIENEMKEAYVDYAMSVIVARALPDARDGFKPVHRRILYTMFEEHITPDRKFRKSAATVGNVIARYHPHGDSAVYDAMVRLAQPFNMRYPLVWPQGNFGSVDGDPAAHMRYTEAKLSRLAMETVRDIGKDTVDWRPNFDNSTQEPVVLPLVIPNLLINGSEGIAVGMSCRIPPHNLGEVIDGCIALIKDPNISIEGLMEFIKGPDFPTGALIAGEAGIKKAYSSGRGKILLRSVSHREEIDGRQAIVIDEIPYMVNKASLVEKAAQAIKDKKISGVYDLRDESSRKGLRIVFELKKKADPDQTEKELFTYTSLESTYGVIILALVDNAPRVLNLKEALNCFIAHRFNVVTRRTEYDLAKAKARLHIVEGLITALNYIHEIIALIKSSSSTDEAGENLKQKYSFSDIQIRAILDMRLQKLTHLEHSKLEEEKEQLIKTINLLEKLLNDHGEMSQVIINELLEVKARYQDERRTKIIKFDGDLLEEEIKLKAKFEGEPQDNGTNFGADFENDDGDLAGSNVSSDN